MAPGRQAVQGSEHYQHGDQGHGRQNRLHPAPVAVVRHVGDPGVEGRVVGAAAEEGHDAVQDDHEDRCRLHRFDGAQQHLQARYVHQGEGHDAQAPQQVAGDDDGLALAQLVRQGPHRQGGHRRHRRAGRHHSGDHAGVPGDSVVEEHIEVHVFHHPGNLPDEPEAQQRRPDSRPQAVFLLFSSHCPVLPFDIVINTAVPPPPCARAASRFRCPCCADTGLENAAKGYKSGRKASVLPQTTKPQYIVLYNPRGYPASSV